MRIAQTVGVVLAIPVAAFTWWITISLSRGIGPFPATDASSTFVFFAPIVGLVGPLVMWAIGRGAFATACWFIAGAPIFGAANGLLYEFISRIVWLNVAGTDTALAAWVVLWLTPWMARICRTPATTFLAWTVAGGIAATATVALTNALEASLPSWMIVYRWWITYLVLILVVSVGACRGEKEGAQLVGAA